MARFFSRLVDRVCDLLVDEGWEVDFDMSKGLPRYERFGIESPSYKDIMEGMEEIRAMTPETRKNLIKGVRRMVGEENYEGFLDCVIDHAETFTCSDWDCCNIGIPYVEAPNRTKEIFWGLTYCAYMQLINKKEVA